MIDLTEMITGDTLKKCWGRIKKYIDGRIQSSDGFLRISYLRGRDAPSSYPVLDENAAVAAFSPAILKSDFRSLILSFLFECDGCKISFCEFIPHVLLAAGNVVGVSKILVLPDGQEVMIHLTIDPASGDVVRRSISGNNRGSLSLISSCTVGANDGSNQ